MNVETFAREQMMEMVAERMLSPQPEDENAMRSRPRVWFILEGWQRDMGPMFAPAFNSVHGKSLAGAIFAKVLRDGLADTIVMLVEAWTVKLDAGEKVELHGGGVRADPRRVECIMAEIVTKTETYGFVQRLKDGRPDGEVVDLRGATSASSRFAPHLKQEEATK